MATEVSIPVWVFVLLWSIAGYAVAVKLQGAIMRADLVGRPSLARKVIGLHPIPKWSLLAAVVVATGPFVWLTIAQEVAQELGARIRRRLTRRKDKRGA